MAKKAKKLTHKQVVTRAKKGWETRRAKKAGRPHLTKDMINEASRVGQASIHHAPSHQATSSATELLGHIDLDRELAEIRSLKGNDEAIKGRLHQIAYDGLRAGALDMNTQAQAQFDRMVVDGFMAELDAAPTHHLGQQRVWCLSDYILRSLRRELNRARKTFERGTDAGMAAREALLK